MAVYAAWPLKPDLSGRMGQPKAGSAQRPQKDPARVNTGRVLPIPKIPGKPHAGGASPIQTKKSNRISVRTSNKIGIWIL